MSSDALDPSVVSQFLTSEYTQTAASALVCYEYLITITDEISTVWLQKFTPVSLLLVSTRWAILLETILELAPAAADNCKPILILMQVCVQLGSLQSAIFCALRVSALWGRNIVLFLVIFTLGLMPLATNIYTLSKSSYPFLPPPFAICSQTLSISDETYTILVYVTRIPLIVSDLLVLVLTWIKTAGTLRAARRLNISVGIASCLIRDGTTYFFILLVLNVTQILTRMGIASPISALVDVVPPLLISRFILNLRRAVHQGGASDQDFNVSQFSAPGFRVPQSVLGNLGESLCADEDEDTNEDPGWHVTDAAKAPSCISQRA